MKKFLCCLLTICTFTTASYANPSRPMSRGFEPCSSGSTRSNPNYTVYHYDHLGRLEGKSSQDYTGTIYHYDHLGRLQGSSR